LATNLRKCRLFAKFTKYAEETALAGWGARIRTWEWRNQKLPDHIDFLTHFLRKALVLDQKVTKLSRPVHSSPPIASTVCPGTESHVRTGSLWSCLIDSPPARADRFRVSRQTAIAVGHEPQAAAQRSSDIRGLPAQPSLKADIDHKKLFPVVTNPAAPGATARAPVSDSADSADPSRPLADAVRAMLAYAATRQRGPK
jgi:hypothetical protein